MGCGIGWGIHCESQALQARAVADGRATPGLSWLFNIPQRSTRPLR
jgi:hypothetical protein